VRALDPAILEEHGCEVAESSKAEGRNRYCDVLPFDYNRLVELAGLVREDGTYV
jgi:protein tyrosine phosphatase